MNSRHELPQGHEGVMSAAQAKAAWLERELASLQKALRTECSSRGLDSDYWSSSAGRWKDGVLYRDHEDRNEVGRAHGDRVQQAPDCQQDRAEHGKVLGDNRAQQDNVCGGNRAQQDNVCGSGRAQQDKVFGNGRAEHGEVCHQARALHGDGDLYVKGGHGQGLLGGEGDGQVHQGRHLGMPQLGVQPMAGDGHGSGGRVELPLLPDRLNPMELGDWLCLIGPIMRDISVNSSL